MKKSLLLLSIVLVVLLVFAAVEPAAKAEEVVTKPHVIIGDNVWLYATDGSKLFLLPTTYYAMINSIDEHYYYITFNGIDGRVGKTTVTTTGYHGVATSTLQELRVAEEYAEFSSILLKKTPDLASVDVSTIPTNSAFTYVGSYPIEDELWYAVKWEQHFGYVRATRTNSPSITIAPFVPEALPQEDPDDTEASAPPAEEPPSIEPNGEETTSPPTESNVLKIILIIGLIIPAVLIIFLIFRPKTKS